jgi:glycosyltransferase involved in cell wall biosynthesis
MKLLKPKVTVGICARNCQDIVCFALKSVVTQDFPHELMEIVFVDDGSADNTLKVVKRILPEIDIDSRILSGKWQGLGSARNAVIRNALGDYIVWVDADEILAEDFVRKQVNAIEGNSRAAIVTGKIGILQDESIILALDLIPNVVEYSRQDWKGESKFPGTGGSTYRVAAAKQVGGFDEKIIGLGEDIEIAYRIRQAGWSIVPGEGVFYESHGKLSSWSKLLQRNVVQGIQSRRLYEKTSTFYSLKRINPVASAIAGVLYAVQGYKVTRRKIVFLLPFHFSVKMLFWFYGFCKG